MTLKTGRRYRQFSPEDTREWIMHRRMIKPKQYSGEQTNDKIIQKIKNRQLKASHVISIGMKRGNDPNIPEIEEVVISHRKRHAFP